MDRISGLPQDVLHRILCCLSQKESVQTSVLAKSWLHLWCTRPKLELYEYYFKRDDHGKEEFMHVLNKTLQGYHDRNLGIDELRLLTFDKSAIPLLQEWIPTVILNMGVKKLKLGVVCVELQPTYFDLPGAVIKSESLGELSLRGWNLGSNCSVMLLRNLRKLVLDDVYIVAETFEKMMLGCPLIEHVEMENCEGLRRIKVNDQLAPNLNHFEFSNQRLYSSGDKCSIEIDAPSVESISISHSWKCFHTHKHLGRLKTLNLERVELTGDLFHRFSSKFPCLEELVLISCSGGRLKKINLSSLSIKRLVIEDTMMKDFKAAFDTPNIKEFVYEGHIPQSVSFTTTTTTSDDRWWVSKLHLRSYVKESDCDVSSWFLKLHQLLGAVSQSEIGLYFDCDKSTNPHIDIEEGDIVIDGGFDNKPIVVEHLELDFKFHSYSSFSAFIKALFGVCRPRQITRKWYTSAQEEKYCEEYKQVTEFLCKILCMDHRKEEEEEDMISWQRDIEEVGLFEVDDEEEEICSRKPF